MMDCVIRPRKKPALLAIAALAIITVFAAILYQQAKEDSASSMVAILICISAAMLVSVTLGLLRTKMILKDDGIASTPSAFSPQHFYKWKEIKFCKKAGNNYNLYTKENQWIGAIDQRNQKCAEFLKYLKNKKIMIIDHPQSEQ